MKVVKDIINFKYFEFSRLFTPVLPSPDNQGSTAGVAIYSCAVLTLPETLPYCLLLSRMFCIFLDP